VSRDWKKDHYKQFRDVSLQIDSRPPIHNWTNDLGGIHFQEDMQVVCY
jgi:hypothetical protein